MFRYAVTTLKPVGEGNKIVHVMKKEIFLFIFFIMCNEFRFEIRAGISNYKNCNTRILSFPLFRLLDQPLCFILCVQVIQFISNKSTN